jgi:soluble lytic murein transglycosylase-like protein
MTTTHTITRTALAGACIALALVILSACTSDDIIRKDALKSLYGTPVASMRNTGNGAKAGSRAYYINLARADAVAAGIDADCFQRQINQESGFNPGALGADGEVGIAQFMPSTAAGLGIDPADPVQALKGAAQLMGRFYRKYGDYSMALAAYNAGSGTLAGVVRRCGGSWRSCLPRGTQAYIRIVMGG